MATGKRRKKRSTTKKAFWKKHPELERIASHIGKMIDNEGLTDFLAGLGCFVAGSIAAYNLGARKPEQIIGTGFSGLIAYKLATSQNLIAGASGTAFLGALGLIDVWNPLAEFTSELWRKFKELPEEKKAGLTWYAIPWFPGLGYLYEKIFEIIT